MTEPVPIPIFPLPLVLVPGELLPLHIFEERYKTMVARTRADGEPFGIVLQVGDGVASVGCTARLVRVLEELPDGRLNIVVRGDRPFELEQVDIPDDPGAEPLVATVVFIEEDESPADEGLRARARELLERYRSLSGMEPEEGEADLLDLAEAQGPVPSSFRIAAGMEMESDMKQRLLSIRSEEERMITLVDYLELVVPRIQLLEERKDAIRGNGKGN